MQSHYVCLAGVFIAWVKIGPRSQFAGTCTMRSVVEVSKWLTRSECRDQNVDNGDLITNNWH